MAAKFCSIPRATGNEEIYSMNADGSAQTNLTRNPANDRVAIFNRSDNKIVFSSTRDNADPSAVPIQTNRLYVMNQRRLESAGICD